MTSRDRGVRPISQADAEPAGGEVAGRRSLEIVGGRIVRIELVTDRGARFVLEPKDPLALRRLLSAISESLGPEHLGNQS